MKIYFALVSLLTISVPTLSFSQFVAEIDMSGDEQIVFCDSKSTSIEEFVFDAVVQRRDRVYFSTFEKLDGNLVPVLKEQGSAFDPSKRSIFVVDGKDMQFAGCFPMEEHDAQVLSDRIRMQATIREEISSFDKRFQESSEKSWCQPVQEFDLSDRISVVLYWEHLEKSENLASCLEKFKENIKFEN